MFLNNFYLSMMFMILSSLMFTFFFKHILLTLISLEFLMINLLYFIYNMFLFFKLNLILISFFLTISICESIIGLALLIHLVRLSGNDNLKSLNILKW